MSGQADDLHALLIGIDHYKNSPLSGCVNDVDLMTTWLVERAGVPPDRVTRLVSSAEPSEAMPTLERMRTALEALAKRASGGRVFVYYSGHGFQRVDQNGARLAREALVPVDAWPGADGQRRLLWDFEVNRLLAAIAENAHLTCVLDCCHSAGATRSPPDESSLLRDSTVRRLQAIPGEDAPALVVHDVPKGGWAEIVACEASELAREASVGTKGERNGLFTRALLDALYAVPIEHTHTVLWADIWHAVLDKLGSWNPQQHPRQLEAWARPVLGGASRDGDLGIRVSQPKPGSYFLYAGTYAGIAPGTELAIYGSTPRVFPPIGSEQDVLAHDGRRLRVTDARGASADAVALGASFELPAGARARVVREAPQQRLAVRFDPADTDIATAVVDAAERVRAATDNEPADIWCARHHGELVFGDDCYTSLAGDPRTLVAPTIEAREVGTVLEHLRRYVEPVRMARRCRDLKNALSLEVLDCTDLSGVTAETARDPSLPGVKHRDGLPRILDNGKYCVRVANASRVDLEVVALLCCTSDGQVEYWGHSFIPARGRATFWHRGIDRKPYEAWLPAGHDAVVERIVAIGTTVQGTDFRRLILTPSLHEVIAGMRGAPEDKAASKGAKDIIPEPPPPPPEEWTGQIQEVLFAR